MASQDSEVRALRAEYGGTHDEYFPGKIVVLRAKPAEAPARLADLVRGGAYGRGQKIWRVLDAHTGGGRVNFFIPAATLAAANAKVRPAYPGAARGRR